MIHFEKGDNTEAPFLLTGKRFLLPNEGDGVVIAEIQSVTRVYGDATLGVDTHAPSIVESGTGILLWVSGGTASTSTLFEVIFRLTTGTILDARVEFRICDSTL